MYCLFVAEYVLKNCANVTCPGQCSIGFSDGCLTCTCPFGINVSKTCPEVVCPGQCSVGLTADGCTTCDCPTVLLCKFCYVLAN